MGEKYNAFYEFYLSFLVISSSRTKALSWEKVQRFFLLFCVGRKARYKPLSLRTEADNNNINNDNNILLQYINLFTFTVLFL